MRSEAGGRGDSVDAYDGSLDAGGGEVGGVRGERERGDGGVVRSDLVGDGEVECVDEEDDARGGRGWEGEEGDALVLCERDGAARVLGGFHGAEGREGRCVVDDRAALGDDDQSRAVQAHGEDGVAEGEVRDRAAVRGARVQDAEGARGERARVVPGADDRDQARAPQHLRDAHRAERVLVRQLARVEADDLEPARRRHREAGPVVVEARVQNERAGGGRGHRRAPEPGARRAGPVVAFLSAPARNDLFFSRGRERGRHSIPRQHALIVLARWRVACAFSGRSGASPRSARCPPAALALRARSRRSAAVSARSRRARGASARRPNRWTAGGRRNR